MRIRRKYMWLAMMIAGLLMSIPSAYAADTGLKKILTNIIGLGDTAVLAIQVGAIVLGIAAVCGGIYGFIQDSKKQGNGPMTKGTAVIMIVCGGLLSCVTLAITAAGETVFGDTSGARDTITIPS